MTNEVDPNVDNIPPGRVTDLAVVNSVSTVNLQFTAPGDDFDSADPAASYVIKYSTTAGNLTGVNFENEEFNTKISATDLVDSDLSPVAGGIVKKISIKASTFSLGRKYVIALKATDDGQNQSPLSNLAQIYRPSSDDSSTSATASTDSSSTVPASSPSSLTSSTEPSTTKDPLPISTELTIGLSVGVFLGSFCATLLGLSSLKDSKLNYYILSVIGAIYWHKMRHR